MECFPQSFLELLLDPLLYGCDGCGGESTSSADIFGGQVSGNVCPS